MLEDVGAALLDGRQRACLERIDVGLDAILAERGLDIWRARLQLRGVLRQCAGEITCLAHERTCQHDESADDDAAKQQVDQHDRQYSVAAQPGGQHAHGAAQAKGEHRRQAEQHQRVQDGADDLPQHPQQRQTGQQCQQHDQCLLPIAIEQTPIGQRGLGQGVVGRIGRRRSVSAQRFR